MGRQNRAGTGNRTRAEQNWDRTEQNKNKNRTGNRRQNRATERNRTG
jgi:hypothetical protein